MSHLIACIGCREIKEFDTIEPYPVCPKCREWEKKHLEEINSPDYFRNPKTRQKEIIPNEVRWFVWERDNFTCKKCGARKDLTVDHIYPEALGGKATIENSQTLCRRCNSSKGKRV
jgi:5-methylcytosine-specific restriction endonuclease McrA